MANGSKNFLLTGARSVSTLDLARQLHAAGHNVFSADTTKFHICSVSNSIAKNYTIPSPRFETTAFVEALIGIIKKENIDYLIPTYEEIIYLAKYRDRFPKSCYLFGSSFDTLHHLHNKWLFYCKMRSYGLEAPPTMLIKSRKDLQNIPFKTYALKACYSRASQTVMKVDGSKPIPDFKIDSHNPWIAQEWLEGKRYCSYSVCHEGVIKAHAVYPVQFAINNNSCVNFEAIHHQGIMEWTKKIVALECFTGQLGFDFFELPNGKLYAIECNPRATNGLLLFNQTDNLDRAFTNETNHLIQPKIGYTKQIALGMALYGWQTALKEKRMNNFFKTLISTRDVVLDPNDIKPFVFQPLIFSFYIYNLLKTGLSLPAWFTYDFNWDGEEVKSSVS